MNTTVLALQEEQVLVAVGKSGAQPSVQALYSLSLIHILMCIRDSHKLCKLCFGHQ